MGLLSRLLLGHSQAAAQMPELYRMNRAQFDELVSLAELNHVIVRGMETFLEIARNRDDRERAQWAETALCAERSRIHTAVSYLYEICAALEKEGHNVAVIKSLDHWPDLGSDLDLYTNADPREIVRIMRLAFGAEIAPRSWGDRLANKWNFLVPGLPEAVEIHMGRLGQTGEQLVIASRLVRRTRVIAIGEQLFRVPSASDRIMISTLQRMYRHFYFRLCDIVDSASLAESGAIDYDDLRAAATDAGIWEGVATYLVIVSDYVQSYRGTGIQLPPFVVEEARFGGAEIYFSKDFLRVPIMPQSAKLYGAQLAGLMRRREFPSGARLSLLPWLATAAVVGQKITGSDKGIW
ncbi:MAG TPA: hypothetical protein VGL00_15375 [Terracidiphilus sp.]|jgi:hypothetical protein